MGPSKSFKHAPVPLHDIFDDNIYSSTYVPPEPSSGQPSKPRRSSSKLRTSTLKKRTASMEDLLDDVEGELIEDEPHGFADELSASSQLQPPPVPPRNPSDQNS